MKEIEEMTKRTVVVWAIVAFVVGSILQWNFGHLITPTKAYADLEKKYNSQTKVLDSCKKENERYERAARAKRDAYDLSNKKKVWNIVSFYATDRTTGQDREPGLQRVILIKDNKKAFDELEGGAVYLVEDAKEYASKEKLPLGTKGLAAWREAIVSGKKVKLVMADPQDVWSYKESGEIGDYIRPIIVEK